MMRPLFLLAIVMGALSAPAITSSAEKSYYAEADFAHVEKVDAHMHLHGELPVFMARAEADGFRVLTINVNYSVFPPLDRQLDDALALTRRYPQRVAFVTTFDARGSDASGWHEGVQRRLDRAVHQGAVGVKVWKDIGMQQRDADGRVVMIDDARFTPIFHALEQRGVVVLGHQGEPRNAWLPLEAMTTRGDRQYFAEHPQYHMYAHEEWPSYEEQLAARDRLLDRHPALRFVALHLASLEWSVDRIGDFLRHHPGASVDLAARLDHLKLQASADPQRVRRFFVEFQDRILYATDLTRLPEQADSAFAAEAHAAWIDDWKFLVTDQSLRSPQFDALFRGLALPKGVIEKIYRKNAEAVFPLPWSGR